MSGPALAVVARLYVQQGYRRASVDPNHVGTPLTGLHEAAEWRSIAELRWTMIEELTVERDSLRAALSEAAAKPTEEQGS